MSIVKFKDLEFDSKDILRPARQVFHSWPNHWTRTEIEIKDKYYLDTLPLIDWIEENLSGRWGMLQRSTPNKSKEFIVMLCFEFENDALMFKLLGGHEVLDKENT